jgi:RIO-like serine/threonine protein kinase
MYIVMELVTGGELFERIVQKKTFKENEARTVLRSMLQALVYLHSHGVVHRDLKPEVIFDSNPFFETFFFLPSCQQQQTHTHTHKTKMRL